MKEISPMDLAFCLRSAVDLRPQPITLVPTIAKDTRLDDLLEFFLTDELDTDQAKIVKQYMGVLIAKGNDTFEDLAKDPGKIITECKTSHGQGLADFVDGLTANLVYS